MFHRVFSPQCLCFIGLYSGVKVRVSVRARVRHGGLGLGLDTMD